MTQGDLVFAKAPAPPHRPRLHGLDALRGFAAAWVMLYHLILRYPRFRWGEEMDYPLLPASLPGLAAGELGIMPVLWFFLISGFVIALTVERCRSGWDFLLRRTSRIFPAYWTAILLILLLDGASPMPATGASSATVLLNLTMLQSFVDVPNLDDVFWSLSVELLFYAYALAFFAAPLRHQTRTALLAWAFAGLAAAVAVRCGQPVSWRLSRFLLLEYGPLLAGGMALFRLWRRQDTKGSALILAICAAAVCVRFHPLTAATCFAAAALIAWSTHRGPAWLAARPLAWLGTISYALYLTHQVTGYAILATFEELQWPRAAGLMVATAACLLVATLVTVAVERPALAWSRQLRRRFEAAIP